MRGEGGGKGDRHRERERVGSAYVTHLACLDPKSKWSEVHSHAFPPRP